MKAAVVEFGRNLAVREIQAPDLPPGGAIVRVTTCGICGSDVDKLLHRSPIHGTVLGHEVVGVIETLSEEAKQTHPHLAGGQRVSVAHHVPCRQCHYCRHGSPSMCRTFKKSHLVPGGFCERLAVSAEHLAHTVFPLPRYISDQAASGIEPLACCLRAVDRIPEGIGNTVLMIGLGFIGLLASQYLRYQGYRIYGIDLKAERVALGQTHHMLDEGDTQAEVILERLFSKTDGRGADVVFLSVVNPKTVELALQAVRDGGVLLLFTSYDKEKPILNQNELYFREISVITSYSPSLYHLHQSYDLLTQGRIRMDPLITHTVPLADLPEAMALYRGGDAMKVLVTL